MLGKNLHEEEPEIILNLVPMIDILTALLFFLLLGFKSQAVMLDEAKGVVLPESKTDNGLQISLTVVVSMTEVRVQESHAMFLKEGRLPEDQLNGDKIVPLYNRIVRVLQLRNELKKSPVLLLADKQLKSDVITKVMKTVGMAGMPNFHIGVLKP